MSAGGIQIESKEDAKKRGVKSPDKADALARACPDLIGGTAYLFQRDHRQRVRLASGKKQDLLHYVTGNLSNRHRQGGRTYHYQT